MKKHTNDFKENIKKLGRELDAIITYNLNDTKYILTSEDLNNVTPYYEGNLLKSVMKQLEIDTNINIPTNTIINCKIGVKVNEEYEYLDYGNYIVYNSEKQEDTNSYLLACYDKLLYSMIDYTELKHGTFPMTISEYEENLCLDIGLVFKDKNKKFANCDKIIENDIYKDLGYKYRDIFDELSQVTASVVCLDINDEVENRYITDTNDIIDKEFFNDNNVNFGEEYGPVNSIVLSRSAESDNIYLRDEKSVAENGLCEIKIVDNQIMNLNNRDEFLPDILQVLNGLKYFINNFSSTGILYYDLCDKYIAQIDDKTYSCIMLNDEAILSDGLSENIFSEKLNESQTDYSKADKTDRRINQTYIIADKLQQLIEATIINVEGNTERITQILQNISEILMSVQQSGGNNLIKNSVGFAGTTEWDLAYDNEETSVVNTISNVELLQNGTSGGAFQLNGVKITQNIVVNSKDTYTFNCKVQKRAGFSGYIKVYNANDLTQSWERKLANEEELNFEDITFENIKINGNSLIVEFYGVEGSNLTITDSMLNLGDLSSVWTQANGEILNTQVNINMNGVMVKSIQFDENGQYVVMSPLEFAGYAKKNGVSVRVFTVNGDTTEVENLYIKNMMKIPPIKFVPNKTGNNRGVATVADWSGIQ